MELIFLVFKHRDGVVVLDAEFLVDLVVFVIEVVDSVHGHPLVESGFGDAEFFFEAFFLFEDEVEFGVLGEFVGGEFDLGLLQVGQQLELSLPQGLSCICELGLGHNSEDRHDHIGVLFPDWVVSLQLDYAEHLPIVVVFVVLVHLVFAQSLHFLLHIVLHLPF